MDLYKAIRTLYEEKKRLDKLIASLEELQARDSEGQPRQARARRGRKKMSAEERLEVSERMKKYWAARRQAGAETGAATAPKAQVAKAGAGSSAGPAAAETGFNSCS